MGTAKPCSISNFAKMETQGKGRGPQVQTQGHMSMLGELGEKDIRDERTVRPRILSDRQTRHNSLGELENIFSPAGQGSQGFESEDRSWDLAARTRLWSGSLRISSGVLFLYFLISRIIRTECRQPPSRYRNKTCDELKERKMQHWVKTPTPRNAL